MATKIDMSLISKTTCNQILNWKQVNVNLNFHMLSTICSDLKKIKLKVKLKTRIVIILQVPMGSSGFKGGPRSSTKNNENIITVI